MIWRRVCYVILFSVVFLGLLSLGGWQFKRYQEKTQWLASLSRGNKKPPLSADDLMQHHWTAFQSLKLRGNWQPQRTLVVSGQLRHGKTGYSVVTPLQWAPSMPWVLVDRGWVASPDGRHVPAIAPPLTMRWIVGKIYSPVGKRYILGPWQLPSTGNVPVIQDWSFAKIEKLIGHPVMPFILRLSPTLPGHYERQWSWAALPPSRHFGYMLQWWGLALVWLVGAIVLIRKNRQQERG
jgi:surfeit locus 1 family protein